MKLPRLLQRIKLWVPLPAAFVCLDSELHSQYHKCGNANQVRCQSGLDNGQAYVRHGWIPAPKYRPTGRLENKGDKVRDHEGDGVCSWTKAREVGPVDLDDAGQAQVDGGAEEGRPYGKTN